MNALIFPFFFLYIICSSSLHAQKHTNALIEETSPYLPELTHNPVDWYPWGEETLVKAK